MMEYEKLLQGACYWRPRRQFPYYRQCWQGGFRRRCAVSYRRCAERLPDGCRHREADGVPIPKTRLGPLASRIGWANQAPIHTRLSNFECLIV